MSARKGRQRGAHEEEHENHERWLVSYADMMTLLMVLFIVLFAISQVDQRKFAALKEGLTSGFGATVNVPVTGGTGIIENDGVVPEAVNLDVGLGVKQNATTGKDQTSYKDSATGSTRSRTAGAAGGSRNVEAAMKEIQRLKEIEKAIRSALQARSLQDDVRFKVTERGLVVALLSDDVFFTSASAVLQPRGVQVLAAIAPVIRPLPNAIAVEGHANSLPITSVLYPSNWELSAARAAGVVRWLAGPGSMAQTRLSATGYGSSRPLYPASDPRSIRFNRRVDLVLLSDQPPEVRSLLPKLAAGLSDL